MKLVRTFKKIFNILIHDGILNLFQLFGMRFSSQIYYKNFNNSYQNYLKFLNNQINKNNKKSTCISINDGPLISVITPVYNTDRQMLEAAIASVFTQTYLNWELILIDDSSTNKETLKVLDHYLNNKKVKVIFRKSHGHIVNASNDGLHHATGEWVVLLDHDDILWSNALEEIVKTIKKFPNSKFIYTDEDKITTDGKTHFDPFFKPNWSPHFLWSCNYITHLACFKTSIARNIGGFRLGTDGAQDWDLFLRLTKEMSRRIQSHPWSDNCEILHIDKILYSWRESPKSTASRKHSLDAKKYAYKAQEKVLADYFSELNGARISQSHFTGVYDIDLANRKQPLVTLIVPTSNFERFYKLSQSLSHTSYRNVESIVIYTGKNDRSLSELSGRHPFPLRTLRWKKNFNYSAICNLAASHSNGSILVFLNDDVQIVTKNWIERLLPFAILPEVGVISPQLLYPNGKIQNSGLILTNQVTKEMLNIGSFVAPYFRTRSPIQNFGIGTILVSSIRDYSAVTGAVMMVEKKKHEMVGGWNEKLEIAFNDVDYSLRFNNSYLYCLVNPNVKCIHNESMTVGKPSHSRIEQMKMEEAILINQWGNRLKSDAFFNKNLYLIDGLPIVAPQQYI